MPLRVLVLEDQPEMRRGIERHLVSMGIEVFGTDSVAEAAEALRGAEKPFHVAILDQWLPDGRGLDVFANHPPERKRPATIVMTGDATLETAVDALRSGAVDYLLKPFSMSALDAALSRVMTSVPVRPATTVEASSLEGWRARYAPQMLGNHAGLLRVFDVLQRVADTDCSILVQGETGTGKELVARAVHAASGRGAAPCVAINCAAVPETLIESELFGHARGAFTGASAPRVGRFVEADGGTLFLDEIGELPLAVQAKLLRVLQEKEVTPLGGTKATSVDVRVVAATHRDLEQMVEAKTFREDLLYRLDVIRVELPPLRARKSDIPLLVQSFLRASNERRGRKVTGIHASAMRALTEFAWPGNVRQLQNVIERCVLMRGEGELQVEDLPDKVREAERSASPRAVGADPFAPVLPEEGIDLRDAVERFENALIRQALERTGWNKNRAASILHMNRTTLVEKLKKKGWTDEDSVDAA